MTLDVLRPIRPISYAALFLPPERTTHPSYVPSSLLFLGCNVSSSALTRSDPALVDDALALALPPREASDHILSDVVPTIVLEDDATVTLNDPTALVGPSTRSDVLTELDERRCSIAYDLAPNSTRMSVS